MLFCRVLGPTEVETDGRRIAFGGRLPRRLLTALIAADGQVVTSDRLADEIWGENPPPGAGGTLQVYISRLRRALGQPTAALLERSGAGYRFRVDAESTDAGLFTRLGEEGRRLFANGRAGEAVDVLTEALDLWRGPAYADGSDSPAVSALRARLEEFRQAVVEERLAALLGVGDTARAVADLEEAVLAAPYRERRWELLVLALQQAGRQAEALAALDRVRELLARELGTEPGPALLRLAKWIRTPTAGNHAPRRPPRKERGRSFGKPPSTLFGRDGLLAEIGEVTAKHRLVTLFGPAGVGKSRVAVEHLVTRRDQDGPWLARLADVQKPADLALAVADAAGLAEVTGDPLHAVTSALAQRCGLLVLDNCEHLVNPVAELCAGLLENCQELHILTTSRQQLQVDGEHLLAVPPLPVRTEAGLDGPAVGLLLDRVRAVRPGWHPTEAELGDARRICAAVDGLPLALELAGGRAHAMGLGEIAGRLHDRFTLLGPVPRGSVTPHATLTAAISWSVDLLDDADRRALLRLWPFEGGFELDAADAVLNHGRAPGDRVFALQVLSSLVSRSLLIADTAVTPTRYRLLETVRAYCRANDEDPAASRAAALAWVHRLVERCADELASDHAGRAGRVLRRELPNLRAAFAHDLVHRPEAALRGAGLLDWFWTRSGHIAEGQDLLEKALQRAPHAPGMDRARAQLALGCLSYASGSLRKAAGLLDQAAAILDKPGGHTRALLYGLLMCYHAIQESGTGEIDLAVRSASRSLAAGRETGVDWLIACGHMALGTALVLRGQIPEGEEQLRLGAELGARCGHVEAEGLSEVMLAEVQLHRALADQTGQDRTKLAAEAINGLRRALRPFRRAEAHTGALVVLQIATIAFDAAGQPRRAAMLRAAVRRHAERLGMHPERIFRPGRAELDAHAAGSGSAPAAAEPDPAARAAGERLSWTEMADLLALPDAVPGGPEPESFR
ncbi:AfsR/SARP family transcriptional regulator [Amycolatopsis nigrescens]|uniref:AfsR/SARP family transcriptional regulator n=1 Tax=Amycolatopsis nigrescens TaxID=381445 RepID=UPI000369170E|nr:BTAD domain-containing putative transcriptional regulator [Amycolatopsis nigrescens]